MKKAIMFIFFIISINPLYVQAGLLSYDGEEIIEVMSLPNDSRFQTPDGKYVDIGYIYKSVTILFVPIWNYDGRLIGITGDKDTYLDLTHEQILGLSSEAGRKLPKKPYLDFWHRFGGKFVFLLVIIFFVLNIKNKMKKKSLYLSSLPTARERLKDILTNSQEFSELDPITVNVEGKPKVEGLDFIVVKNFLTSFISVSVFDMKEVSVAQVSSNNDDYFERLLPLKKQVSPKAMNSLHYLYFIFDTSPSDEEISLLKSLKKRKIINSTNMIPCIIDCEKQEVILAVGATPSKKILENCFLKSEKKGELLEEAVKT